MTNMWNVIDRKFWQSAFILSFVAVGSIAIFATWFYIVSQQLSTESKKDLILNLGASTASSLSGLVTSENLTRLEEVSATLLLQAPMKQIVISDRNKNILVNQLKNIEDGSTRLIFDNTKYKVPENFLETDIHYYNEQDGLYIRRLKISDLTVGWLQVSFLNQFDDDIVGQTYRSLGRLILYVIMFWFLTIAIVHARLRKEVCADARNLEEENRDALIKANLDDLTGLPNRSYLFELVNEKIRHLSQSEAKFALCFLDLDSLKAVNDSLGHAAGDALLETVARRVQKSLRGSDVFGRIAGDEFLLVLDINSDEKNELMVLDRLLDTISQPIVTKFGTIETTCSIGVSIFPDDGRDLDGLIIKADMAMYGVKNSGKNNWAIFENDSFRGKFRARSIGANFKK